MSIPQPLWESRALLYNGSLVVADLHIGYEFELEKKGYIVPSQTDKMITGIREMLVETGAKRLIINGDLKHNIPQGSWQEYREIPKALDSWLKETSEIHLLKGNHDGGIENYTPSEIIVHDPDGAVIDGIGYFHGHATPSEKVLRTENIVTAHSHPAVSLKDRLDRKERYHCWVRFDFCKDDLHGQGILMPTYNELLGGTSINEHGYLGPFFRNCDISDDTVYLTDGTCLGRRTELMHSEK